MSYWNFMANFKGPHGGIGKRSWARAAEAGYNPNQIKTAIQQLHRHTGISVGHGVRKDHMRGVKGYAHGLNRFQGAHGNLGHRAYEQAKAAGFAIEDIPELARRGGMFLPEGAQTQWEIDMADKYKEEELDVEPTNYTAAGSDVGSGASGVLTKKDPKAGKTGSTSDLRRTNLLINKQTNLA
tara:strand:+ start:1037 stop:1582 length:546 start_codon:yes stop_codon:yes gene_type:complete